MNACRLCSAASVSLGLIRDVELERCPRCGSVQVASQPTESDVLALYGPGYFDHGKYRDPSSLAWENKRRLDLLRSARLPRGSRVLDAGCANGEFISAASHAYEVWGIDVAESAVAQARQRCPDAASRIRAGFLEEQQFAPESFDALVLWDVIEHLWDPVRTGQAMTRLLKPGGYLFLSTPNIGSIWAKMLGKYWPFLTVPEHLVLFTPLSMTFFLETALGLKQLAWQTKGKWANLGFVVYKARRVAPRVVPEVLVRVFERRPLSRLSIYVPTGDIQYAVARKL